MASTHGRKALPLPQSLEQGLRELGFRQMTDTPPGEPASFRHPTHRRLWVSVSASNIPGEPYVVARWGDGDQRWMLRLHVDQLLRELGTMVDQARGVNTIQRVRHE